MIPHDTPSGQIEIEAESCGCFSSHTLALTLSWSDTSAALTWSTPSAAGSRPLTPSEASALAARISEALQRPDTPPVGRSTNRYLSSVRWRCGTAIGEVRCEANEAQRRSVVLAFCRDRPDLLAKIPPDLYGRAAALYEIVEELSR